MSGRVGVARRSSRHAPWRAAVTVLLVLASGGCTPGPSQYQLHDGSARSRAQLAVLHVSRFVYVDDLDGHGELYPSDLFGFVRYGGATIELPPGPHAATVRYRVGKSVRSEGSTKLRFELDAGKEYVLTTRLASPSGELSVGYVVVDCASVEGRELTQAARQAGNAASCSP